jgi:hypothetical protein
VSLGSGKFGLPIPPLDPKSETRTERKTRVAAVKTFVFKVFRLTKIHLGERNARELFIGVTHRKRGRRASTKVNDELLRRFDAEVAENPKNADSAPRRVAESLSKLDRKTFGPSSSAIEKRIRRLSKERHGRAAEASRLRELIKTADGTYPGMLSEHNMLDDENEGH